MSNVAARPLLAITVGVCALVMIGRGEAEASTTEGRLATRDGKRVVDVPLEHTQVTIRATGHLAEVEVEQTFKNPYDRKIEAVYLFPLPTGAAVNDLEIQIGARIIKGEIARRDEAKATYVKAKKAGFVAALLTQERPNLFSQNLANLEPNATVIVRMRYLEPLRYEAGGYQIVFPMVAGPRHIPSGAKQAADKDAVQPAVLPPDTRSSHDIGLTVDLDAGVALKAVASSSHQIVTTPGPTAARTTIALAPGDTIPNKDFILRYDVAGDAPELAVLAHRTTGDGAFFLTLQPPKDAVPAQITPREIVFVLDTSSSMRGAPLAKARELVRTMLAGLGPDDTFQIVRFADTAGALGDRPIANKPKHQEYAMAWMTALEAGGGTAMTEGIAAALDVPHDPLRLRLVVFITDGYVGNEDEILATVHAKLGDSRLYSFGVGTAVNRYLLEEMASFGRGAVQVVRPDEDTAAAVATFHARIARPVLTDVTIDWAGLAVADVTPAAVPDLFVGQPIVLAGHYARAGAATIVVKGKAGGRDVQIAVPVELPEQADRPAIATVWARARIGELSRAEIRGATDATRTAITDLALEHHLMSRYTAFVAVDRSRTTTGGDAKRVAVPVEVPAGLRATSGGGWGAGAAGGMMGSISSSSYGSAGISQPMAVVSGRMSVSAPDPTPPKLDANAAKVDDAKLVQASLASRKAAVQKLFAKALKSSPDLAGTYILEVSIGEDGTVKTASVIRRPDGDGVDAFAASIVAAAKGWTFDATGDEVKVKLVFVLGGSK
jgi:Ca-activated chloride channel family protein